MSFHDAFTYIEEPEITRAVTFELEAYMPRCSLTYHIGSFHLRPLEVNSVLCSIFRPSIKSDYIYRRHDTVAKKEYKELLVHPSQASSALSGYI